MKNYRFAAKKLTIEKFYGGRVVKFEFNCIFEDAIANGQIDYFFVSEHCTLTNDLVGNDIVGCFVSWHSVGGRVAVVLG